ncbi:MAG: nuclear transport factor 2 family protein [Sphingomonas sp.]
MDRAAMLQTIDAAHAARQRGDLAEVLEFFSPGATFRMVGMSPGPEDAATAIGGLIDQFHFAELERLDALVDGDRVAVRVRISAATGGGRYVDSELLDIWRFGVDGKIVDLVEFADTAQISILLANAPDY